MSYPNDFTGGDTQVWSFCSLCGWMHPAGLECPVGKTADNKTVPVKPIEGWKRCPRCGEKLD